MQINLTSSAGHDWPRIGFSCDNHSIQLMRYMRVLWRCMRAVQATLQAPEAELGAS